MRERPILFSAPMVRAILARGKSQTRRIVKPGPAGVPDPIDGYAFNGHALVREDGASLSVYPIRCPYGQSGDRLWVREAWRVCAEADAVKPLDMDAAYRVWYEADAPHQQGFGRRRPGMFMPRWASRITLEVTGVRVERLQDISEADAMAEGVDEWARGACGDPDALDALGKFELLWCSINGRASWDANPWVWRIEFKQAEDSNE